MRLSTQVGVCSHSRVPSLHLFIPLTRYHKQPCGAVQWPRPQQAEDKLPASVLIVSLSCNMQNPFIPNCLEYDNLGKSQQTGIAPLKHVTGMWPSFPLHHTGPPALFTHSVPATRDSNAGRSCSFVRQCGKRKELGALSGIDSVNLAFVWNLWTITLDWMKQVLYIYI